MRQSETSLFPAKFWTTYIFFPDFFPNVYVAVIAAYLTLLIVIIPFRLPLRLVGVKHGLGKSLFGIKAVHWTFYRWWKYGAIYWWTNPIDPKGRIYHLSNIQVRIIFFYNRLIFHSIKRILYDIWHILFVILETDYLSSPQSYFVMAIKYRYVKFVKALNLSRMDLTGFLFL